MTTQWTYHGDDSRQLTARDIADRFAADVSEDTPRTVGHLYGNWLNDKWVGEFTLIRGQRTYHLKFDGEVWSVSA
jgi:hypothetical protein